MLSVMSDRNIESSYYLSPMQSGMLFHHQLEPRSGINIEQLLCSLNEELNGPLFIEAWKNVIERHPALRTSFRWQDTEEPLQEVHSDFSLQFEEQDWRELSTNKQQSNLQEYLDA